MLEPLKTSIVNYPEYSAYAKTDISNYASIFCKFNPSVTSDGIIGDFQQSYNNGDCYLLSSLYSLSKSKKGAEILKQNIKKENNGSFTITLPGALIIKKDYAKNNKKCLITGTYTITSADIRKARKSGKYSKGDIDVLLYELAFERYRREVMETNKLNKQSSQYGVAGQYTGDATYNDPLRGGIGHDAIFVLTGKQSVNYEISDSSVTAINSNYIKTVHSCSKKINRKALEKLLDKIEKFPGRYSGTFGIKLKENGKIIGNHAVSITKIENGKIYFINPWDSKKEFSLSKQAFLKAAYQVNIVDMEGSGVIENISDFAGGVYENVVNGISNLLKK